MQLDKVLTKDDSFTFYNSDAQDYYHSQSGAVQEAFEKHADALEVAKSKNPVIFDICFGLGYNAAAALDRINGPCTIICFENDLEILKEIKNLNPKIKNYEIIKKFISNFLEKNQHQYQENDVTLIMEFGDFRQAIQKIQQKADFVFFDPFSPAKVPELWTQQIFEDIKAKMNHNAKLSTYSCARFVRNNLESAGFRTKTLENRTHPSTIASPNHDPS